MADTQLCKVCLNYYDPSDMVIEKGKPRTFCKKCKAHLSKFYSIRAAIRRALKKYANMRDEDIVRALEQEKENFLEERRRS
jgi:hypothetical protein